MKVLLKLETEEERRKFRQFGAPGFIAGVGVVLSVGFRVLGLHALAADCVATDASLTVALELHRVNVYEHQPDMNQGPEQLPAPQLPSGTKL